MEEKHEVIHFNSSSFIDYSLINLFHIKRHFHSSPELILVLSGKASVIVEDHFYELNKNDLLLINKNETHELHSTSCVLAIIHLDVSLFETEISTPPFPTFTCNTTNDIQTNAHNHLRTVIAHLFQPEYANLPFHYLHEKSIAYEIMHTLLANFKTESDITVVSRSNKNKERVTQIVDIIDKHYASEITLSFLAKQVHLSVPYLSRFFDKQFGTTFLMYLNKIRLHHAVNDLLSTDLAIEQIALNNGFSGAHSFVQIFKKQYDCLPSVYRRNFQLHSPNLTRDKMNQNASYETLPAEDYFYLFGEFHNTISYSERQHYPQKIISCSITKTTAHLNPLWNKPLFSIDTQQFLMGNTQNLLAKLKKELSYTHIYCQGLLLDEYSPYKEQIIDYLLSINLKPFILFRSQDLKITSADTWEHKISDFLLQLKDRYGKDEISTWIFSADKHCPFYQQTLNLFEANPTTILPTKEQPIVLITPEDIVYDTCDVSCYIAQTILESLTSGNVIIPFTLLDTPISNTIYHNGNGLFTYNNVPKASYQVLSLFKHLSNELVDSGDNWLITKKEDSYQLLLFQTTDAISISNYIIELHDVECEKYLLSEMYINHQNGSSYEKWIAMGGITPQSPNEIDTLISLSTPPLHKQYLYSKNNTLTLEFSLSCPEVRLFVLKPAK